MYKKLVLWVENYLFRPNFFQKIISYFLLPLSFIYCFFIIVKRKLSKKRYFDIPIVSVGNLIIGGSGKTPIILNLAQNFEKPAIILRGYKRNSSGLLVVSEFGKIIQSLHVSGDEAMLYAKSLKFALVIVSEDRIKGILKAQSMGAKIIFLDDGFSKANIKKYDILLEPISYPKNKFTLPSGAFREPLFSKKYANIILKENKDFIRKTNITNKTQNMVLVTAIANASRLESFLPTITCKYIFPDHYNFTKKELEDIIKKTNASSILTTSKDFVKMDKFDLPISLLDLKIEFKVDIINIIKNHFKLV